MTSQLDGAPNTILDTVEGKRLSVAQAPAWRRWGLCVGDWRWGSVREDHGAGGAAWDYPQHDHARRHAYRWGKDAIGGVTDEGQRRCLGVALWNERDAILKERLFGLSNPEDNHGEDVEEL